MSTRGRAPAPDVSRTARTATDRGARDAESAGRSLFGVRDASAARRPRAAESAGYPMFGVHGAAAERGTASEAFGSRRRRRPALSAAAEPGAVPAHSERRQRGQASVELVAFLPLVLLLALAVFAFAAAQAAREEAGAGAEAAALALLQGRDAHEAARAALPPASRARARIDVAGTSVRVHLRPRLPLLADRLAADEEAHAAP